MSLVFDALRRMQGDAATVTAVAAPAARSPRAWWQRQGGWCAIAIAVVAAPTAFVLARGDRGVDDTGRSRLTQVHAPTSALPPPPAIAPVAPSTLTVETRESPTAAATEAPTVHGTGADTRNSASRTATTAPAAVPPPAASPAGSPTGVTEVAANDIHISVARRDAATRQDDGRQTADVQRTIAAIEAAQSRNDRDAVRAGLDALSTQLRADSLTLLRMRAWAAHADGDLGGAEDAYRKIIERVPDDENAGINLALLQAGRGDLESARARLDKLAARGPSRGVTQAMAQLGAPLR